MNYKEIAANIKNRTSEILWMHIKEARFREFNIHKVHRRQKKEETSIKLIDNSEQLDVGYHNERL